MAHDNQSQRDRIEALKKQRDEAIKELDALLLEQAAGGTTSPEPPAGGGPGSGGNGP